VPEEEEMEEWSLLMKIAILRELSEANTQQFVNFKVL